jgi:hypothetical protein
LLIAAVFAFMAVVGIKGAAPLLQKLGIGFFTYNTLHTLAALWLIISGLTAAGHMATMVGGLCGPYGA